MFEKYSDMIFNENPSSGSWVVWCGRTDRHDVANSRFSQILRTRLKTATHNAQTHRLYDSNYALPSYCVVSSWAPKKIPSFCQLKQLTKSPRGLWKETGKVLLPSKFPRGNTDIPHGTPGFLGMQFEKSWSKLWRRSVQMGLVDRICPRVEYDWISYQWHTPRSSQCQYDLWFFQLTRKSPDRVPLDQSKMNQPPSNFGGHKIIIPKRNRPEGTICAS